MEHQPNRLQNPLEPIKQALRLRFSQKTTIFLICLALSSLFWLLNAFSKEYTTIVRFPLSYEEFPEDRIVTSDLPSFLYVEVTGHGFDLLSYFTGTVDEALSVKQQEIQWAGKERDRAYFVTAPLYQRIADHLNPEITANKLLQDTLKFRAEQRVQFSVPVKAQLDISLAEQHFQDGPVVVDPPIVELIGPKSQVEQIVEIETELLKLEEVAGKVKRTLRLKLPPNRNLALSTSTVVIEMPVDRFTDASIDLPLTIENLPDSLELKTIPDTVTLEYQVALGRYSQVTKDQFEFAVDFEELEEGRYRKLQVHLREAPEFLRIVGWRPTKVEYIVKK